MRRIDVNNLLRCSAGLPSDVMEELTDLAGVGLFNLYIPTGDISLNRNTAMFTGYEPGEIPHSANTKENLTYEDDWPMVAHAMQRVVSGESDTYQLEYRMRRRDGSLVSVSETALVYERDEQGKAVRLAGLGVDLSRLRWAEQKARDMESAYKRMAMTVSHGDLAEENRMLRAANAAAAMVIGGFHQDYEAVLRQSLQLLGESVQADRAYIWRNALLEDGRLGCFQRTEWAKSKVSDSIADGTPLAYDDILPNWREVLASQKPILARAADLNPELAAFSAMEDVLTVMLVPLYINGEFWGFIGFDDCAAGRMFTEMEAEIMGSGAQVIASSISRNETYAKLSHAREAAMANVQAKGEFLSRMSHEIRTPLNAIIGMTAIAKATDDPQKVRYCLEKVDVSSRQLLGIINDVLDMSKIDANKFEILAEAFDFEKMLQNVLSVVQVKLDEKRQALLLDFVQPFRRAAVTDELRLSQVLINLLTNAVKFTPEGGRITLRIRCEAMDACHARLHIAVEDTGIGIDADKQKSLFQSFEQVDGSITRQYGGTGLGLAISQKIVDLMGGEITVESTLGEGSTFSFDIEIGLGDDVLPTEIKTEEHSAPRVLLLEGNAEERALYGAMLDSLGAEHVVAQDGGAARAMLREGAQAGTPFDAVMVDWRATGKEDHEMIRQIRVDMDRDALIVLSSMEDWADIVDQAEAEGIAHFLIKPLLPGKLYRALGEVLTQGAQQEQAHGKGVADVADWQGKTILLAEDIEINREIVESVLEPTGVAIVSAADGIEAVEAFAKEPERYDAILMDVQMPRMDGLEATRRIRALRMPRAQTVPIIAMTANAFKEDAQLCIAAGMDRHLAKPLDVAALMEALRESFAQSEQERR